MAAKIIGLFKGKKKEAAPAAAPTDKKGPVITQLGGGGDMSGLPGIAGLLARRRRVSAPTIISDKLGG